MGGRASVSLSSGRTVNAGDGWRVLSRVEFCAGATLLDRTNAVKAPQRTSAWKDRSSWIVGIDVNPLALAARWTISDVMRQKS
jgi:hypothetical protein